GLDPRQILKIRNLIRSFHGERTVILSTHIIPEVEKLCDRVAIINEGKIVAIDSRPNLSARLQTTERISVQFAESPPPPGRLEQPDGVLSVLPEDGAPNRYLVEARAGSGVAARLFHRAAEERWPLVEVSPVRSTLEDVFLQL